MQYVPDTKVGKRQFSRKSRSKNSSRVMCQRRSGFHSSIGQPLFAKRASGRSRALGSNLRFSTQATSRSHVVVFAPMKLSRRRRSRFSRFESTKSHAANTAYVSSIIAPLMRVNEEATWDRADEFMRFPDVRKEPRVNQFPRARIQWRAVRCPDRCRRKVRIGAQHALPPSGEVAKPFLIRDL